MTDLIRKPIKGWEGYYEIDNMGNFYSLDRVITVYDNGRVYQKPIKGRVTKGHKTEHGYMSVQMCRGNKKEHKYVHQLVAEAFIPNPNGYDVVNHIDENKQNNRADNLEWCTQYYNLNYRGARERQTAKTRGRTQPPEERAKRSKSLKEYFKTHKSNTYGKPSKHRKPVLGKRIDEMEWTEYPSVTHAAKAVGIKFQDIGRVCNHKIKQTHGYVFKFVNAKDEVRPVNYEVEDDYE